MITNSLPLSRVSRARRVTSKSSLFSAKMHPMQRTRRRRSSTVMRFSSAEWMQSRLSRRRTWRATACSLTMTILLMWWTYLGLLTILIMLWIRALLLRCLKEEEVWFLWKIMTSLCWIHSQRDLITLCCHLNRTFYQQNLLHPNRIKRISVAKWKNMKTQSEKSERLQVSATPMKSSRSFPLTVKHWKTLRFRNKRMKRKCWNFKRVWSGSKQT